MKIIFKLVVILVSVAILYGVVMFSASELGGEVVTLIRPEPDGSTKEVRVWIVDADDQSWIEHGDSESYWINQLTEGSEISIVRGIGEKYIAASDENSHSLYHELRNEKYGISNKIIEFLSFGQLDKDNCNGIPVKLRKIVSYDSEI